MSYLHFGTVLTVLSIVAYGNALRCWSCSSDLDAQCGDPFNHTSSVFNLHHTLQECSTQLSGNTNFFSPVKQVCQKVKQTAYGRLTVVRSCVAANEVGDCSSDRMASTRYGAKIEYCGTCDTDGCNSAEGLYTTFFWRAIIPATLALVLLY